jgi:uncharacterized membrane protein YccF (DUF307 family)
VLSYMILYPYGYQKASRQTQPSEMNVKASATTNLKPVPYRIAAGEWFAAAED